MAYRSGMTSKRGAHRGSGFLRIDASELLDMARRCEQELGADAAAATLATALGRSRAFIADEIARQVSAVYELDEGDISQGSATYGDHQQNLNLSATAGRNSLIEITYWGRRLTVGGHFPFTPRRPRNRNYRVTTTIRRGSPKLNSARTFVPNSAKWGKLVWERTNRRDASGKERVTVRHTLSIPEFVGIVYENRDVAEPIIKHIEEEFIRQWQSRHR